MKKLKPSFIPAILWLILATVLLTLPGKAFPSENWFNVIWLDKWIHVGLFAVLVFLWCWAYLRFKKERKQFITIFIFLGVLGLVYGTGMEFVQKYFIPNRSFDLGDILADGIGSTVGSFIALQCYAKNRPL